MRVLDRRRQLEKIEDHTALTNYYDSITAQNTEFLNWVRVLHEG